MKPREIIKKTRISKGLSQEALARRLGKPQSYISKIEQGERRVDIEEFIQLCIAMDTDPVKLLTIIKMELRKCH